MDDQHHLKSSPKCTMCFISFLTLSPPLRAAHSLSQASEHLYKLFLLLRMLFFIFSRKTQTRLSPPSMVYATKRNTNISFGKKKKKASLPLVTQTIERLEEGVDQAQSREGKVLSGDWPRDLVGRDEWAAGNLPSSPRTWQEHGKLCHLLKEAWCGLQVFTKQLQGLRAPPIGLDAKCIST